MKHIESILELADKEFEAIERNGKFRSREEIDSVYKLMDIVKDGMCVMQMEEDETDGYRDGGTSYERDGWIGRPYRGGSYDDSSYARGRGRNARRDRQGRYSSDGGSSYRDGGRSMRGYSRDGKEEYLDELRMMMEDAPDEQTRQSIQRMIQQMEQG